MKSIRSIAFIMVVAFLMMGCPGPNPASEVGYQVYLYYKNDKGENLLDPGTNNHYDQKDVTVNEGWTDFNIDSARYNSKLPKGYALSFGLPSGSNATGKPASFIIKLDNADTDTLISKNSGEALVSCTYNGKDVLPSPFDSPIFPVVIVKNK